MDFVNRRKIIEHKANELTAEQQLSLLKNELVFLRDILKQTERRLVRYEIEYGDLQGAPKVGGVKIYVNKF